MSEIYTIPPDDQIALNAAFSNFLLNYTGTFRVRSGEIQSGNFVTGSTGWKLDAQGNIEANSGTFRGTLTATTGTIGGFSLGTDYLRDTINSFGLASTVSSSDDVRLWAGDTFANRATAPFHLFESGKVEITVSGAITPALAVTNNGTGQAIVVRNGAAAASTSAVVDMRSLNGSDTGGVVFIAGGCNTTPALSVNNNGSRSLIAGDGIVTIAAGNVTDLGTCLIINHQTSTAAGTKYGMKVTTAAASTTNVSGYFTASGATNNHAIIVDAGQVGIGTIVPAASALMELSSTVGALLLTRMTTTQRDALTAVNGMILYNSTTAKFQGYEAGAWTNLI